MVLLAATLSAQSIPFPGPGGGVVGTPGFVNSFATPGRNFTGTSCVSAPITTSTRSTSAGQTRAVLVRYDVIIGTPTVTVSSVGGGTWTNGAIQSWSGGNSRILWAWSFNGGGNAADSVTVTFGNGGSGADANYCTASALILSNSGTKDAYPCLGTGTSTTLATGSCTTATASEIMLVGCTQATTSVTLTAGSGYTMGLNDGGTAATALEYQVFSSIQTGITTGMTSSGSFAYGCAVVSFSN